MNDVVIVGAGLAGLLAANFAARRGASVTLVAQGRGSLSLSHGCLRLGRVAQNPEVFPERHPYRLAGLDKVSHAVTEFHQLSKPDRLEFLGDAETTLDLPTASGAVLAVHFAPRSLAQGSLSDSGKVCIAGIEGFRDFDSGPPAYPSFQPGPAAISTARTWPQPSTAVGRPERSPVCGLLD